MRREVPPVSITKYNQVPASVCSPAVSSFTLVINEGTFLCSQFLCCAVNLLLSSVQGHLFQCLLPTNHLS